MKFVKKKRSFKVNKDIICKVGNLILDSNEKNNSKSTLPVPKVTVFPFFILSLMWIFFIHFPIWVNSIDGSKPNDVLLPMS